MNPRRHPDTPRKGHQFGGSWTAAKLELIAKYLSSYTAALKDKPSKQQPFKKGYIDAFAGTGYRDARRGDDENPSQALLLPDLAEQEPQEFLDGSARLALKTEPQFDSYVFIERSASRSAKLEALKLEFQDLASRIQIRGGDANIEIQKLCKKDWSSHRAVLFLDPYGMQVEWKTIEAIADTKAMPMRPMHHFEDAKDVIYRHVPVKEVAHRIDEDGLRLSPSQRCVQHLRL
ncbi:MAG TPA: three-Cys-motif partner protein TcmP [Candidatus Binataceae bacterium]|nr:three-Cys-motif partner protein TcmP [Candidatus Binataceae bacterium]